MNATRYPWNDTMELWSGLVPPLFNPAILESSTAVHSVLGVQQAALTTLLESCRQAQTLTEQAFGWQARAMERMSKDQWGGR